MGSRSRPARRNCPAGASRRLAVDHALGRGRRERPRRQHHADARVIVRLRRRDRGHRDRDEQRAPLVHPHPRRPEGARAEQATGVAERARPRTPVSIRRPSRDGQDGSGGDRSVGARTPACGGQRRRLSRAPGSRARHSPPAFRRTTRAPVAVPLRVAAVTVAVTARGLAVIAAIFAIGNLAFTVRTFAFHRITSVRVCTQTDAQNNRLPNEASHNGAWKRPVCKNGLAA